MPDDDIVGLMRTSGFSFIATVQRLGAATMADVPVNERTAVVRVDHVLHTPAAFTQLAGSSVTVQLDPDSPVPAVGEQVALFANATAFGESVAVDEVGRVPIESLLPEFGTRAAMEGELPMADFAAQVEAANLQAHADTADAIVVARVMGLAKAGPLRMAEHDPDWWLATFDVDHVEKGDVEPGTLQVLYANSLDVQWRSCPKPKASQEGLWLLHATEPELQGMAPFRLVDPEDFQPVQHVESLRPVED